MPVFLHVPKTGGTWVKAAVANAGIDFEEYVVDGDIHGDLSYCPCRDRFVFGFVREPLGLYQAYWRFKDHGGMGRAQSVRHECAAPTFDGFVENVLQNEPGWCSRMFEDYVGRTTEEEIDFVGRFESLADDLVRALRMTSVSFDHRAIHATPPVNVSNVSHELTRWSPNSPPGSDTVSSERSFDSATCDAHG